MKFRKLLGVYALITLFSLMVYATAQGLLRQGANLIPATNAKFLSQQLSLGANPQALFGTLNEELPVGGAPFSIIADQNGKTLTSTYLLDNKPLTIPKGVYDNAKKGQNRVTWQPKQGIREAIVVMPFASKNLKGFAVSGVSLEEPENTISALGLKLLLGWILTIVVATFFFAPQELLKRKKS